MIKNYDSIINRKVSITEFYDIFSDDSECLELVFNLKYKNEQCKKCNRPIPNSYARSKRKDRNGIQSKSFRCRSCHTEIYPLAGTVLRNVCVGLMKIFYLLYIISISKKSMSAMRASNTIGVCYKTAYKIMMRIRSAMENDIGKLKGIVEIDEVFIGKGSKVYNWSSISTRKQPIVGMIERDTKKAKVFLVEDRSWETLYDLITENVEYGSTIYTDGWKGYSALKNHYTHESVDHTSREFVRGDIHTNNIESMWGRFKGSLRGSHIQITDKYVDMYMNEMCWRQNHKDEPTMRLFDILLKKVFSIPASCCVV